MTSYRIVDCTSLAEKDRKRIIATLRSGLIDFNKTFCNKAEIIPVLFTVQQQGKLAGGLVGRIAWGWMHLEILWLDSELRGLGIAKSLLSQAEELAIEKGCTGIHLDTFSFQAPDFYTSIGYTVFGKIDNYPDNHCRYFMQKKLRRDT